MKFAERAGGGCWRAGAGARGGEQGAGGDGGSARGRSDAGLEESTRDGDGRVERAALQDVEAQLVAKDEMLKRCQVCGSRVRCSVCV